MGNKLSFELKQLDQELKKLKLEIKNLKPYTKDYIQDIIDDLDPMKSDFTNKIQQVLENMKDTKVPTLVKKLEHYPECTQEIIHRYEELDMEIGKIVGNKKGKKRGGE